ncbi:unnamed protein product [Bemisia tabaci]|uniref:Uncharacterized protein n=1 Tax=Bemisia tabaci TaxID=7038 RepID=A0A9P0F301_BEMTA|nr:unnamed protein product [Bemisia tabaci]
MPRRAPPPVPPPTGLYSLGLVVKLIDKAIDKEDNRDLEESHRWKRLSPANIGPMSCVRDTSPTASSKNAEDTGKQESKKRRFHPLRGLRRIFRRKPRAAERERGPDSPHSSREGLSPDDAHPHPGTDAAGIQAQCSRSASQLIQDPSQSRRSLHSTVLSVSHDSIFSPEIHPESQLGSVQSVQKLGHSNIRVMWLFSIVTKFYENMSGKTGKFQGISFWQPCPLPVESAIERDLSSTPSAIGGGGGAGGKSSAGQGASRGRGESVDRCGMLMLNGACRAADKVIENWTTELVPTRRRRRASIPPLHRRRKSARVVLRLGDFAPNHQRSFACMAGNSNGERGRNSPAPGMEKEGKLRLL